MGHQTGHTLTDGMHKKLKRRLRAMAHEFQVEAGSEPFGTIHERLSSALARISVLLESGKIFPSASVRISRSDPPMATTDRTIRLGVYPVNGNPLHWGHVLCGLEAVALQELDLVAFVVQGIDRRKHEMSMATQRDRHIMARLVLEPFKPLLAYSSIGLDSELVGEDNLFELLRLNPHQKLAATYIVGADHYRTFDAAGKPDTLHRLEANMADQACLFDSAQHDVAVMFVERGSRGAPVPTQLAVSFVPEVLDISSTQVRQGNTAFTPLEVFRYLRSQPMYRCAIGFAGGAPLEPASM